MSVVTELEASLKTEFPALVVTATEGPLQDVRKLTLLIRRKSVDVFPGAPLSHRNVGVLLTLISPLLDLDAAAEQLDDGVLPVLDWLDSRYLHEPASLVGWNGSRLAYDIPATITAQKES
ncbi:hypothetical protein [Microbacterium xylanilyticum]